MTVGGERTTPPNRKVSLERRRRIVQLTDWLPPEFSAVSQYAMKIAEELAGTGADVTVVGLTTTNKPPEVYAVGDGCVRIIGVPSSKFDRTRWSQRLLWTVKTNLRLIVYGWDNLRRADQIRFTGSPPFLLHFVSVANLLLRKELLYRITDFYPESIMAALSRPLWPLEWFLKLTNLLRRRVHAFEVLGHDMERRLLACGIARDRITLSRDGSPVDVHENTQPLSRPVGPGARTILYSGNWGVAHDIDTFVEAYRRHHGSGSGTVILWLNATGSGAEQVDRQLRAYGLPFHRQSLVPLVELASLLVTPDAHLITLRNEFMGYVLPSKIYGCIASNRPILFIGPEGSDVHELCANERGLAYARAAVGDVSKVERALEQLASLGTFTRDP